MEKMLIGLVLVGLVAMLLTTVVSAIKNSARNMISDGYDDEEYQSYLKSLESYEKELQNKIDVLESKLTSLETKSYNVERDFSVEQELAFDLYQNNGIQLPVDIIDEVLYLSPSTFEETIKLIESKRKNWKNELSKKVYGGY